MEADVSTKPRVALYHLAAAYPTSPMPGFGSKSYNCGFVSLKKESNNFS